MRITSFGITAQYMNDLNNVMAKYQDLEQQLSTGRKLNQPSDDPVAFESDMQSQTSMLQVAQWQNSATESTTSMQNSDAAMNTLQGILGGIRTQVVQAVNGTNTQEEFGSILAFVSQQIQAVAQTANSNDGQQYIFSGTNGKTQPIDASTGNLVWNAGVTPDQNATIGSGVTVAKNVNGQQLFNLPPSNNPADPSLVVTLNKLQQDMKAASQAPDGATLQTDVQMLQTDLSNLDTNIDNVSSMRADLGGRMKRIQAVTTQLSQTNTLLAQQKSQAEEANLAQVMTQLTTQQTVYQAALLSGQRLILPTLADVMK